MHADPGRFGRRRDQDRAARHGRRHAQLGAALPAGRRRRRVAGIGLLPGRQPQQALGHLRHQPGRRPAVDPRAGAPLPRVHRKLQGGRHGALRAGLRQPARPQPGAGVLQPDGLWPDGAVRAARRLRLRRAGHGRVDEHHRRARRLARRRPAEGGCGRGRPVHRPVQRRGHPGRAAPRRAYGRRPVPGHGAAGHANRHAGQPGRQLPRQRQGAGAHGQRAPEHRALPGVRGGAQTRRQRRPHHPGGGQRRAVCQVLPSGRAARTGGRPPLRQKCRSRAQPRRTCAHPHASHGNAQQGRLAGRARSGQGALRRHQQPERGV